MITPVCRVKLHSSRLIKSQLKTASHWSWSRDDFWLAAVRRGFGGDTDQSLRTRGVVKCQADIRQHHCTSSDIWHIMRDAASWDSANTAQVPGTVLIVTRALILWWSEAPPDKPCAHSHVRSCSVKMSQKMTSGYRFSFSLIPPFTQHVILLCKHLFSAASLPWCPFCWLFSAFLCHCQNFPPDEDPPSWQLAPPPRGYTEMVNGEMH